ncbi:hypothetical protein ANANG_G00249790 [Anguilla anguilla]|uniref:Uncharacterized protein n=1 Tax=Anguilla anguilla TaxID=7936 RepID=A0A9D3LW97_ANGAN|nr:hypothetical protein ANANG_G00249790 [Anguilla anguilla]
MLQVFSRMLLVFVLFWYSALQLVPVQFNLLSTDLEQQDPGVGSSASHRSRCGKQWYSKCMPKHCRSIYINSTCSMQTCLLLLLLLFSACCQCNVSFQSYICL